MSRYDELHGSGWAFPLSTNGRGGLAMVAGEQDIEQSVQIILGTMPGERVMRPEFGCRAWELIFAPNNAATRTLLARYVQDALEFWEPRIELINVEVEGITAHLDSALLVTIHYRLKTDHDPRSLVYPFYIMGEE